MIGKVANDPYGIGFASGAEMDPNVVQPVQLNVNGIVQNWSRKAITNSINTTTCLASGGWALIRGFSVVATPNTAATSTWTGPEVANSTAASTDFLVYLNGAFKNSLIMNSAFYPPLASAATYPSATTYAGWTN